MALGALRMLDAKRDWGHAEDYVEMQWLMLQQDQPEDFVIATGEQYSVREFVTWSAEALGIALQKRSNNSVNEQPKPLQLMKKYT